MTLQHLMMMRRLDRVCARMNTGLAAVAIVLGVATGGLAAVRFAQFCVPELPESMPLILGATAQDESQIAQ